MSIGNDEILAKFNELTFIWKILCWPCRIFNLQVLVYDYVAATVCITKAALPLVIDVALSWQTGSPDEEPVERKFNWRWELVIYTVKCQIKDLLRPTWNLKKKLIIINYVTYTSSNSNWCLSLISITACQGAVGLRVA